MTHLEPLLFYPGANAVIVEKEIIKIMHTGIHFHILILSICIPWFCHVTVSHMIKFCLKNVRLGLYAGSVLSEEPKLSFKVILHILSEPQEHDLK